MAALIDRYSRPPMREIWTLESKYRRWLEVEILACEAWARLGGVPAEAVEEIRARADFDVDRVLAVEEEVRHDVIAFVSAVAERVGPAGRYLHYGLTSSDVVETGQALQLRAAADLLLEDLDRLLAVVKTRALEEKETVMVGRTHGIHAEPITFGVKLALWYAELERDRQRLARARETVCVGKISGAVGTFARVPPQVEAYVCDHLGLTPDPVSNQVLQRDRHAEFLTTLAIIGGSVEQFALEVRNLQRTEVREVEEPFREGQKGSSAMPHKQNPVESEKLTGLSRVLRGNALAALEDMALWHERDISHSSVERIILPDSTMLLDYMLDRLADILGHLTVHRDRMRQNLESTGGLVYSQRVLLSLVERGMAREEAYRIVQQHALAAWAGGPGFRERIGADPRVAERLSPGEIAGLFDYRSDLAHVDEIFRRAGIL